MDKIVVESGLGQDDVVALDAADRDLGLVEDEAALLTAFFRQDDREHGLSRPDVARVILARVHPRARKAYIVSRRSVNLGARLSTALEQESGVLGGAPTSCGGGSLRETLSI